MDSVWPNAGRYTAKRKARIMIDHFKGFKVVELGTHAAVARAARTTAAGGWRRARFGARFIV